MSKRLLLFVLIYQSYLVVTIVVIELRGLRAILTPAQSPFAFWFTIVALVAAATVILTAWQKFIVKPTATRRGKVLLWLPIVLSVLTAVRFLTPLDGRGVAVAFNTAAVVITALVAWLLWDLRDKHAAV